MKDTQWGPTLLLNLVRSACAGLVWFILMALNGQPFASAPGALIFPIGYLMLLMPTSLASTALSKMGVPFVGWFPAIISLMLLPGDPLTYILHKVAPKLVPVEKYSFLNFCTVILVKDPHVLT